MQVPTAHVLDLFLYIYTNIMTEFPPQIDRVLTREKHLRRMLRIALGMDNMVELAVEWFDRNGDGVLDRLEYFEMSRTIGLEQLRKEVESKSKDEISTSNSDIDVHSSNSPKDEL